MWMHPMQWLQVYFPYVLMILSHLQVRDLLIHIQHHTTCNPTSGAWGSTYSYVSLYFAWYLGRDHLILDVPFEVSTPMGESVRVDRAYRDCAISIEGKQCIRSYDPRDDVTN